MVLQNYNEAWTILNRSLQVKQMTTLHLDNAYNIAVTLFEIARCHMVLQNYNMAWTILNRSL